MSYWRIFVVVFVLAVLVACGSSQKKEDGSSDTGLVDFIVETVQSEQGQKAIETAKEKLSDKETQEKLKSSLSGKKKD